MKKFLLIFCFVTGTHAFAQDIAFAKSVVKELTDKKYWGRGYTNNGMKKAADYLIKEFQEFGIKPLAGKNYLQKFYYPVNTFPGKMQLQINGKALNAGIDFIVSPDAIGVKGKGKLVKKDSVTFINNEFRVIINIAEKLTWSVSQTAENYTLIQIDKKSLPDEPLTFDINIENKLLNKFEAANVCGMVKGTQVPDSFIFITAHYDHLGGMGNNTYFPGANDNASGISLLLNVARYYPKHPQKYSIGFICFAGEEAGLLGSKYFTEHPLINLNKIRFLTNTDLAGTGEEGITVVNATEFTKEFQLMNAVNNEQHLLTKINARGKAANSDHYWFTEKGVPAFFFYTLGGIKAYHDVYDRSETLPLNKHEDLFKLLIAFNAKLMGL
ncbi:hypothetical protein BH09BAC2_BH09BAC2_18770 [soil metagenome]